MHLLLGLFAGPVLVLAGFGLGAVGATVTGTSRLAELQQQAVRQPHGATAPGGPAAARTPARRGRARPGGRGR